jgi:hypothetical protein
MLWALFIFNTAQGLGQTTGDWKLEKMPADLETDFALSALPPQLRAAGVELRDLVIVSVRQLVWFLANVR